MQGRAREGWIVAAVLLAAGAGWFLWRAGAVREDAAARPGAVATPSELPGADLESTPSLEEAGPAAAERARSAVAVGADPAPVAVVDEAPAVDVEPPPEDGIPVRVLRGRTDEPVPLAIVGVAERFGATDNLRLQRMARGVSVAEELAGNGRYFQAGEDGVVLVPRPKRYSIVVGDTEDLWGLAELWPGLLRESPELRLFPNDSLRVRVVSELDRTPLAGAEVAIRYEVEPTDSETLGTFETGSDGEVRIGGLPQYAQYYWAHTEEVAVVPWGLFAEEIAERFEPDAPPELIELALPPTSELAVLVVDAGGQPVKQPIAVRVGAGNDPFGDYGRSVADVTKDGRVLFRQIGLDLALKLRVEGLRTFVGVPVETRSAAVPGGRVTVTLPLGELDPVLSGRALGADGKPLAGEELATLQRWAYYRPYERSSVVTGADGSFEVHTRASTRRQSEIYLELTAPARPPERPKPIHASVRLEGPLPKERVELGDVTLAEAPLLAGGRVTDKSGTPIPRALLQAYAIHPKLSGNKIGAYRSREDGSFEIRGSYREPTLKLAAYHPSHRSTEPLVVAAGASDVQVVLEQAGRIEGSVIFEHDWYSDFGMVQAIYEDGDAEQMESLMRPGYFAFDSLQPGTWTIRLGMDTDVQHGIEIPGVVVRPGETTLDPRLQNVDLRAKVRQLSFRVVDSEGQPIDEARMYFRAGGSTEWTLASYFDGGETHLFTVVPDLDLYFYAEKHRGELLPNVRDGRDVVLGPGLRASFRWTAERPPWGKKRLFSVDMQRDESDLPALEPDLDVANPDDDPVTTYAPEPGRYRIRYQPRINENGTWRHTEPVDRQVILRDTSDVQEFLLTLPQEVVDFMQPNEADD
ncbi:MAG: prealbumin-like fold domain-containing protein [Planctomycetota bacterium]